MVRTFQDHLLKDEYRPGVLGPNVPTNEVAGTSFNYDKVKRESMRSPEDAGIERKMSDKVNAPHFYTGKRLAI